MSGKPNNNVDTQAEYIQVWEDLVSIRDLFLSILICVGATIISYFIAPNEKPFPLFFGLLGALIGFIICSFLFKPKRNIKITKDEQ